MEIAKIENGSVTTVGDYREVFPQVSFPSTGPSDEFLADNGCKKVSRFKAYDADTQKLVPAAPYASGEWVYVVEVQNLTQDEIDAMQAAKDEQAKALNVARAKRELEESDWCENASVRNTEVTPHLTNASDFDTYRLALRAIVVNRPATVESWPDSPNAVWA